MELSWLMRIRIMLAVGIGVLAIGFGAWPMVSPPADGVLTLLGGSISSHDILICGLLAFGCGFLAAIICWPYGRQIGIIAAPAGLGVWALKSADMSRLFQMSPAAVNRVEIYSKLRFEGFVWLAIIICGCAGAIIADKIFRKKEIKLPDDFKPVFKVPEFAQIAISVIASVFIANFLINILASDVGYPNSQPAGVVAQPAGVQIAFAVFLGFGAAGFGAKYLIAAKPFWPAAGSVILIIYYIMTYTKIDTMAQLAGSWPANFFIRPVTAVLPIQMVCFAFLGSVWGYWMAARFHIWRTHQD